MISDL
jgi:hypothetical protein